MILLSVMCGVLTVAVLILALAAVDQYRTLELIREELHLHDRPEPLEIPDPAPLPSQLGLPMALDSREHLVVLFLSTSCATCKTIARKLDGRLPPALQVILENPSHSDPVAWLGEVGLSGLGVIVDVGTTIADGLRLSTTPAAFLFVSGSLRIAQTIPSYRQLEPLLSPSILAPLPAELEVKQK